MNRKRVATGIACLVFGLPLGTSGSAQEPEINNVQCFVVATVHARMGREEQKPVAQRAEAYYLGRISGPPSQLRGEFAAQLKTITEQNNGRLMSECARAMNRRAEEIASVQQALAASERQ